MKGLLALVAATNARLYTPRLFPPRPEPPLPPLSQEACDRQARAVSSSTLVRQQLVVQAPSTRGAHVSLEALARRSSRAWRSQASRVKGGSGGSGRGGKRWGV